MADQQVFVSMGRKNFAIMEQHAESGYIRFIADRCRLTAYKNYSPGVLSGSVLTTGKHFRRQ
jgi:hypothetical protein